MPGPKPCMKLDQQSSNVHCVLEAEAQMGLAMETEMDVQFSGTGG